MRKNRFLPLIVCLLTLLTAAATAEEHEHVYSPANFQTPETCTVCGQTRGERKTADFETYGLDKLLNIKPGRSRVLVTRDHFGQDLEIEFVLSGVSFFDGNDKNCPALDGYEWQSVNLTLMKLPILFENDGTFIDEPDVILRIEDYYDIRLHDDTNQELGDGVSRFTANFNGADYEDCLYFSEVLAVDLDYISQVADPRIENRSPAPFALNTRFIQCAFTTATTRYYFRVPAGYDGIVLGVRNSAAFADEADKDKYVFEIAEWVPFMYRLNDSRK